jgi:hypothetical protein
MNTATQTTTLHARNANLVRQPPRPRGSVPLRPNYYPFVAVQPGETYPDACERHQRQTGHTGACIVVFMP